MLKKILKFIIEINILDNSLNPIRPGYVELINSIDDLTEEVLRDSRIVNKRKEVEIKSEEYYGK